MASSSVGAEHQNSGLRASINEENHKLVSSQLPIFINGRFVTQPMTGVQRYAHEVSRRLVALGIDGDSNTSRIHILAPEAKQMGRISANLWEQVDLLTQSYRGILFSPGNVGPWLHRRQLVTIHDIGVYDVAHSYSPIFRNWVRASFQALTRTAKRIITDSNYSRERILNKFTISPDKVTVVYPGADHILDVQPDLDIIHKLNLEPQKYVLVVGSLAPHKNLTVLGAVDWHKLGVKLCVVGSNNQVFNKYSNDQSQSRTDAIFAGRRTDSELRALYMHALAYVFPSSYEGFGAPPLEAMYCGCPTIVSEATCIPEVCGNGALYFDHNSAKDLETIIGRILHETGLREQMIARGYERAAKFTWDFTARDIAALLQDLQG